MINFNFDRNKLLEFLPKNGIIAEIGVARGLYTEKVLKYINPKKYYLIDGWKNIDLGYPDKNMVTDIEHNKRYSNLQQTYHNNDNIKFVRLLSLDAATIFDDKFFDWVFIDADHSYTGCLNDLTAYNKLVKDDGYIVGHDYIPRGKGKKGFGVTDAVHDFVDQKNYFLVGVTNEDKYQTYVIAKNEKSKQKLLEKIV
jgi:cephalosporin hydroxylase